MAFLCLGPGAFAQSTWKNDANGTWSTSGNWNGGVPNSSALSGVWSGSLTIYGWTGIPNTSGTSNQIYFGNNVTGLTNSQLSQISFNGFGPGAMLLTSGELVPMAVPEAGNVFAGLLLVLLVLHREVCPLIAAAGRRAGSLRPFAS